MSKKITLEGLDHFKDNENAMIAGKPESTNTATVAHAVGEYFYWKGVLHIVTAAIAVGGTIQTNTNVKPAVLADDVGALKESIANLDNKTNANFQLTNIGEQSVRLYSDFVRGAMWEGQIQTYGLYRVINTDLIEIPAGTKLTIAPNFWIQIAFFENGTYKNSTAWTANSYDFANDSSIRISIRRITEVSTELADIVEFTNAVTFPTVLKKMGLYPVTARTQITANSKVVLIGDSIVAGYGGTGYDASSGRKILTYEGNDLYANDNGTCWANMLADYLRTNYNCTVLNNGLFGFNSVNISQNISTIIPSDATHVISCFGINDRAYNYNTVQNYQTVIDYCNLIGAELVIVSICPTIQPNNTYPLTQYDILTRIKDVCEQNVYEVCDLFSAINEYFYIKGLTLNTNYLPDNLHPNDALYTIIFNLIKGLLHV